MWTTDTARGTRLAEQITAGAVNINDACTAAFSAESTPMGGMKASGLGRRHGQAGLLRYTESQTVAIQRVPVTTTRFGLPRGPLRASHRSIAGTPASRRRPVSAPANNLAYYYNRSLGANIGVMFGVRVMDSYR